MKCPKCEAENTGEATVCRSCGCALKIVETAATSKPIQTCAMAKKSLVSGLISFCTFFLTVPLAITSPILGIISGCTFFVTALLAIMFGITSLIMIARSHGQFKGKGIAIAGIVVPMTMLILLWTLLMAPTRPQQRVVCGSNLAGLGKAMLIYASDNNGIYPTPSKWCDLLIKDTDVSKKEFLCPLVHKGPCNYAMNKNIEKLGTKAPPDMVLLFDSKPGWNQSGGPEIVNTENHQGDGCNILFNDTHVRFVRASDINGLQWTAEQ